ncbi:uncharacterized protein LOC128257724 isoform X2 [Drosophila gunungcola]|uniref:uncharacterized protein LOC128257724 isoform X2 n=1 Tax=Drosophila gunungcola TaxID=103775 RepID=UPI0022DF0654|nr:uncharacterized protein LOC128257724 isoform X2 [Drosophila gunungcola]
MDKDIFANMSESRNKEDFLIPTVREVQQMLAELLSHGDDITWDLLSANQETILKSKVNELNEVSSERTPGYPLMFSSIWGQRKFTNGQSLTAAFFVMIVDNVTNPKLADQSRSWHLYPVYRCRRCVDKNIQASSLNCCMVYVTQHATYSNWNEFLNLTTFGPGVMVTPNRGVYKLIDGQVELKTYLIEEQPVYRMCSKSRNRSITPETLAVASKTQVIRENQRRSPASVFTARIETSVPFLTCERMLNLLLNPQDVQQSCDASELSTSLILFTHSVNNLRLASSMINTNNSTKILVDRLKCVFTKISEESARNEGNMDLIRSANTVPTKEELNELFNPKKKTRQNKTKKPTDEPMDSPEITTVNIKGEDIKLEDYGTIIKKHIVCSESFENLITCMSENLEPEMFKLILQLMQTFMETTRMELIKLLKYFFSTESVLHQIILCIMKHQSNLDINEVKEQSSEILRRVRYFYVSCSPNSRPEFMKKCEKCAGYYDVFNK